MEYTIAANQMIEITVYAKDFYSRHSLIINPGETYRITCKKSQYWWDWFVPSSPSGYYNPLASWAGLKSKNCQMF